VEEKLGAGYYLLENGEGNLCQDGTDHTRSHNDEEGLVL